MLLINPTKNFHNFVNQNHPLMSTLEIKLEIFDKLKKVEDLSLLKKIKNLLKNVGETETYQLNEYELEMLMESEEDIKHGRLHTNEDVIAEENKWLNE